METQIAKLILMVIKLFDFVAGYSRIAKKEIESKMRSTMMSSTARPLS
jgi:hypothetical protein